MKQLQIDDRTFERAELQAQALRLTLTEYLRNLIEQEPLNAHSFARPTPSNPIGLFANDMDIIDDMMSDVMQTRTLSLRLP